MRASDIDQEEVKWIKSYAVEVATVFDGEFKPRSRSD